MAFVLKKDVPVFFILIARRVPERKEIVDSCDQGVSFKLTENDFLQLPANQVKRIYAW